MDNPPNWLASGPSAYTSGLLGNLSARTMGAADTAAAAKIMDNFTQFVSGLSLAGVDTLTFNGATALKQYLQTGNIFEAGLSTLPGQIYDLFSISADPRYPTQFRAQLLGEALAIAGITIVTAGRDGFGPKFDSMLSRINLLNAWPKFKAYLLDIGSESSPAGASETAAILQHVATKFPAASADDVAFAAERIDFLVQSMKDNGFSPDEVNGKLSDLVHSADASTDVGDVAEASDEICYASTGTILIRVEDDRTISLYGDTMANHRISTRFLQDIIPGFVPGQSQAIVVTVHRGGQLLTSYHLYKGGKTFGPALPSEHASGGELVRVSFGPLPVDSFVKSLPAFELTNSAQLAWVADKAIVRNFVLNGDSLSMDVLQDSTASDIGEFTVTGIVDNYPSSSSQFGAILLQFHVTDYIGRTTDMRIQSDGFSSPALQIIRNGNAYDASMISFDGFRLSVAYTHSDSVATVYVKAPSDAIYSLGKNSRVPEDYLAPVAGKYSAAFQIENVVLLRNLENNMLEHGSEYVHGRLGAEIAYVLGTERLGLQDLVIQEPSAGGRDLFTKDNIVAMQVRLLVHMDPTKRTATIQDAISSLVDKLQKDYANQSQMVKGYAILSYVDLDGSVKTIVLEVPKH